MFQKYRLSVISFLLMVVVPMLSSAIKIPGVASEVQVHALLIISANDPDIGQSVAEDSRKIQALLNSASNNSEVRVTIIETDIVTEVTEKRMLLQNVLDEQSSKQNGISTREQVTNWIRNLEPKANDTILVYYAGHAGITESGSHVLHFGLIANKDVMGREELRDLLSQKSCRLKLLITDVDSSGPPAIEPLNPDDATITFRMTNVSHRIRLTSALEDLFLEHEGFLNLTAATEGEHSWAIHPSHGGLFTSMLYDSIVVDNLDLDGDTFLSWEEVFKLTRQRTIVGSQRLQGLTNSDLKQKGIESQRPKYYGELPQRIKMKVLRR